MRVARRSAMSRLNAIAVAALLFAGASVGSSRIPAPSPKLDRALREWIQHPTASARVLLQVQPGTADRVRRHLAQSGLTSAPLSTAPNIIVAQLDANSLRSLANDPQITRVSIDAMVRT